MQTVSWPPAPGGLRLFPNPAHAAATLLYAEPGDQLHLGRVVATTTADAAGKATLGLPAGLASGVYVVRTGTQATRLLVE